MTGLSNGFGSVKLEEDLRQSESLGPLLDRLADKYGTRFRDALFDTETGQLKSQILVVLNARVLAGPDRLETQIADGDAVVLMLPISGG